MKTYVLTERGPVDVEKAAAEKAERVRRLSEALDVRHFTAWHLVTVGLDTPEKVHAASDALLLDVPTVGERTLAHLRGLRRLRTRWNGGGPDRQGPEVAA